MGERVVPSKAVSIAVLVMLLGVSMASAAVFSSSKVEFLWADYDKRSSGEGFIFTFANATGFTKGDSFFFIDVGDAGDSDETDGMHMEFGPRLSLLRASGKGPREGFVKDVYVIAQLDFDANRFNQRITHMAGLSVDLNVKGWKFVKVHLQYRDDPLFDGSSAQLNLVWNRSFANGKLTFDGFLDYTTDEGTSESNILTQPALVWHASKHIGVGIEYQYWQNRLGIDGLDESTPQVIFRWTF